MEYHYEALPMMVNMLLFAAMVTPYFRHTYLGKSWNHPCPTYEIRPIYYRWALLIIAYCTFGFSDRDFFHYQALYEEIVKHGPEHMEPVYIWLIDVLPKNYYVWRFTVWGAATLSTLWTFRRLRLETKTLVCIFTLYFLVVLSIMRGNLGLGLCFLGFTFIVKPIKYQKLWSYILGMGLIISSYFFHKSMFVTLMALAVTPFRLKKWQVIILLLLFPLLVMYVADWLQLFIASAGDEGGELDSLAIGARYAEAEASETNIFGMLSKFLQYTPIVGSLSLVTYHVTFRRERLPKYIYVFYIYWFAVTYVSFLFFFQNTSNWLFIRFMFMSYIPMIIVLTWFYSNRKATGLMKFFLVMILLYNIYKLCYEFYWRIREIGL